MVNYDYKSVLHNVSVSDTNDKYRYMIPVENVSRYKIQDTFYVSKIRI